MPEVKGVEIDNEEVGFLKILIAIALVGFVFIAAVSFLPPGWLLRSLLQSIGEALIVAAILGITVDRYIKEFLVRKASANLFKYLVGYKLPEPIQNRLRDLMATSFIRENYQATYTLTPASGDQVILDVRYQFDLKNVTTAPKDYVPRLELEKHDNPVILELRCDGADKHFQKIASAGGTIGVESSTVPGVIEAIGEQINLLPQKVYPVSGHYQLRVPCNHSDTMSFLHPTVDVTVKVQCPDDFQFVIEGASITTPKMS